MRISDWSSDVCSSDLGGVPKAPHWMVLTASWPRCPIGLSNQATNCSKAGRPIGSGTTGYEGDFHPPRPTHRQRQPVLQCPLHDLDRTHNVSAHIVNVLIVSTGSSHNHTKQNTQ